MSKRFISVYPGLRVVLRHERTEQLADGSRRQIKPGLYAQFVPMGFTDHEREAAYARFGNQIYKGSRMTDQTLTVPASQTWRLGTFDTGWLDDPDDMAEAERMMLAHKRLGIDFILVEPVRVAKPWPKYDALRKQGQRTEAMVAKAISEQVTALGIDPNAVAAYERENENRYEVLAALAALTADKPEEELVEA